MAKMPPRWCTHSAADWLVLLSAEHCGKHDGRDIHWQNVYWAQPTDPSEVVGFDHHLITP
ncbi:hypothetical protein BQ8482_220150 [Mesorhizobium delmotii]|uniref:Uncharacterized protein n=1 Tax=Mesorhizobium delmotii TaxID=1631247 RepID=A0A2P9ALG1_9HYPH|nr:hypothetical protein BQ8482_220150 [Mesorhizobium delmotii]